VRVAPGSAEAKQQQTKQPAGEPKQPQQPRPRAPPKPLAVLEECDVFGKLPAPIRKQASGIALPTSPRAAGGAEAGPGSGRQGPAAAGGQLQLPKQPSDLSVKAPAAASPADKQAAPLALAAQEHPVNGAEASPRAQGAPASPQPVSPAAGQAATPVLSPLKRRLLERSGQGVADAAAANKAPIEAEQQQGREVGGEPPAKRQNVHGEDAAAAAAKRAADAGGPPAGQAGTVT
jgi:hypothetical protein